MTRIDLVDYFCYMELLIAQVMHESEGKSVLLSQVDIPHGKHSSLCKCSSLPQ